MCVSVCVCVCVSYSVAIIYIKERTVYFSMYKESIKKNKVEIDVNTMSHPIVKCIQKVWSEDDSMYLFWL